MFTRYIIFVFCCILCCCLGTEQFSSIMFKSDEIIPKITNQSTLVKNQSCNRFYKNIIENQFICVFPNSLDVTESKFIYDTAQIVVDTLLDKDDITQFYNNNVQDYNQVYKNYMVFYLKSIGPINNIIKNVLKYLANKFIEVYRGMYVYMQGKYRLDEEKELIILPIPSKIRYFTPHHKGV